MSSATTCGSSPETSSRWSTRTVTGITPSATRASRHSRSGATSAAPTSSPRPARPPEPGSSRTIPEDADAFREVVLTPPTESFEESASLDLGGRQLDLRYLGRGHTDNDIVAVVPDASVLFAGDLLENAPAPAFGDSFPISWPATGQALLELVSGTVVPGHGDPFDRGFAERQVARAGRACGAGARGGERGDRARRGRPSLAVPGPRDRTGARTRPARIGVSKLTRCTE